MTVTCISRQVHRAVLVNFIPRVAQCDAYIPQAASHTLESLSQHPVRTFARCFSQQQIGCGLRLGNIVPKAPRTPPDCHPATCLAPLSPGRPPGGWAQNRDTLSTMNFPLARAWFSFCSPSKRHNCMPVLPEKWQSFAQAIAYAHREACAATLRMNMLVLEPWR